MKTNDVTGRYPVGIAGIAIEMGRPGIGTSFTDIQTISAALAKLGVEFEPNNPLTALMVDTRTGTINPEVLNEKVLSAILEFKISNDRLKEMLEAIRAVSINRTYLSSSIIDIVIKDYINRLRKDELSVFSILTAREREVLQLIAEGKTMKEIAPLLNLSVKTVEKHRANLMDKLDLHSASELTAYAMEKGIVTR